MEDDEEQVDQDGDGKLSMKERGRAALEQLSRWNPLIFSITLAAIIAPPAIVVNIFLPCWDCYDFEAAGLHEIGHLLGAMAS